MTGNQGLQTGYSGKENYYEFRLFARRFIVGPEYPEFSSSVYLMCNFLLFLTSQAVDQLFCQNCSRLQKAVLGSYGIINHLGGGFTVTFWKQSFRSNALFNKILNY